MHVFSMYSPSIPKKDEAEIPFPCSTYVAVALDWHTTLDTGEKLLSAQLMSNGEIDEAVDRLISELEEFRKKAKKKLAAHLRTTLSTK